MTTTGELLSIIEQLELVDAGEAASYLDEDNQIGALCVQENDAHTYTEKLPAPDFCQEQAAETP